MEKQAQIRDGWQLKSFAVLWSRFSEILLLDADQVPVYDPAAAFEWPEYRESGAIFWPDIIDLRVDNPIWDLLGLPAQKTTSLESGQLLFDKKRHWKAICAANLLNESAETVYQLIYGDKDSFLLAWLFTNAPFTVVPHRPFVEDYCLNQRDFLGDVFLQHRTNAKWAYSGEQRESLRAVHGAECDAALIELRRKWNGRIFNAPARSLKARHLEEAFVNHRRMKFEILGVETFTLEFLTYGELGEGRSHDRQNWYVTGDGSEASPFLLVIQSANSATYALTQNSEKLWVGERLRYPKAPISATLPQAATAHPATQQKLLVDEFLDAANFFNAGPAADVQLYHALVLLSHIEPGVEQHLRDLSETQSEEIKIRLLAMADVVATEQFKGFKSIDKNVNVISEGYSRFPDKSGDAAS